MAVKNLDNNTNEIRAQITEALKEDNEGAITEALVRMAENIQSNI
ncbi:phage major capsid protein, partial [Clostridium tarantellae]|nr:phage major capsid protein [Clostridium tarantellae]